MTTEKTVTVVNKLGLHARAAAKLVKLTSSFGSKIQLEHNGVRIDAKSIMGILMLAAPQGSELKLSVEGDDSEKIADAVANLFAERFGEDD